MKKCMLMLIAIVLAIVLGACSAQPVILETSLSRGDTAQNITTSKPEDSEAPETVSPIETPVQSPTGIDRTIKVDAFDISGKEIISEVDGVPDFAVIYDNAQELSEVAKYIVYGEVIKTQYTDYNASARIYYDFKIDRVLRGDFKINDIITVGQSGGYVRGSVYAAVYGNAHFKEPLTDDVVFHESLCGAPEPAVGEKYVLFIGENNLLEGTYAVYGAFMGKYVVDGENIKRHVPPNEPYFYNFIEKADQTALSELFSIIEKTPLINKDTVGN